MINEQTLTLFYYGNELTAQERQAVETALGEDAELTARYATLQRQLQAWQSWQQVESDRAPSHLVQRWHDVIDEAAAPDRTGSDRTVSTSIRYSFFSWGAAAAAALAFGIGISVYFYGNSADGPTNAGELIVSQPADRAPTSFQRGFKLHLKESQRHLVDLSSDTSTDPASRLSQMIQQNRLFERAAKENDSPKVARVLRAFDQVLTQLAAEDLTREEAEMLRQQLTFELNVVLTKLARDTSDDSYSI